MCTEEINIETRKKYFDKYNLHKNSFAHHIEIGLRESLEKYWDFEKNTVNPWEISKCSAKKVWIKCQDTDYHGSYEIRCSNFKRGSRCGYCNTFASKKIHPKDSFAQYHIDNTDKDFLEKYWDWDKNIVSPWEISVNNKRKIWIKCQNEEVNELNGLMKKDYHPSYEIRVDHFKYGSRCSYCSSKKVHPYDSFGYHHFDKVMSWHPDNDISPFKVARVTHKKYKFICNECGCEFEKRISDIDNVSLTTCNKHTKYKGELKIINTLNNYNINYIHDNMYFKDLVGIGGGVLRPDFILPDKNVWIEYDGEFHYRQIFEGDSYNSTREHDKLKNKYAKKHGWKMIRIPYWEFDNIEEILEREVISRIA